MSEKPSRQQFMEAVYDDDDVAVIDMIRQGADLADVDENGSSILMRAAQGRGKVVRVLIAHKVDVNHKNDGGYTALMWAVGAQELQIARFLVEQGADINARAEGGWSVLMMAVRSESAEIVQMLLDKGADIEARNDNGQSVMDLLDNDGRIGAIAMKDMIVTHKRRAAEAVQQAIEAEKKAERDEISLRLQHLRQRMPKVRLKRPGL